ncbi:MAG: aldo/keto reductase [Deltaproteobacteria bacterium]|nr:aldo/keto reductase [Deltaproteobacteria bacterium]
MSDISSQIKLANGLGMPRLGLGTWGLSGRAAVAPAVEAALEAGYRSFDTASVYGNEAELGASLRESGLARGELFVASKVWNSDQGPGLTRQACLGSLERLGLQFLDLLLLHWPVALRSLQAWEEMERLLSEGLVRAIGVSNFGKGHLARLLAACGTRPMVNQIELHPYLSQEPLAGYCRDQGIVVEAYSPLARGQVRKNQFFQKLARRHGRSVAQVVLRWHFQGGRALIPKSATPQRVRENGAIFDFVLSPEEMAGIGRQNQDRSVLRPRFELDGEGWVMGDGGPAVPLGHPVRPE